MAVVFLPDYAGLGEAMRSKVVTDELHRVAVAVQGRAREIAGQEGEAVFADALQVVDGVRPKGRPFSRVIADDAGATGVEFGSDTHPVRRRILGRAAGVTIF